MLRKYSYLHLIIKDDMLSSTGVGIPLSTESPQV